MNIDYNANQYLKKKKGIVKTKKKGNETECHAPQFLNMWSSCWNNNKKKKRQCVVPMRQCNRHVCVSARPR